MVQFTNLGALPYREEADEPAIDLATQDLAEALQSSITPHFATTAARDTAYSGYSAAARAGMACSVGNPTIWYAWDGTQWVADFSRRVTYMGFQTWPSLTPGSDHLLSMPTIGAWNGASGGVAVPESGVYVATLIVAFNSLIVMNRAYVQLNAGGAVARVPSYNPTPEDRLSCTLAGIPLGAGNIISCGFGHNAAGNLDTNTQLLVTRVAS